MVIGVWIDYYNDDTVTMAATTTAVVWWCGCEDDHVAYDDDGCSWHMFENDIVKIDWL